jgi:hypothetical protein
MRRIVLIALSLALPFLSSACSDSTGGAAPITGSSGESTGSSSNEVRVEDIDPAALLESRPFDSTALGALHGVIQVRGKVPKRFPIGARKVKDCCAFESVDHMSDIILVRDGKLENAYVTVIAGYERDEIPPASSDPVFMDQKGCIYTPHVTGMQVGQKLLVGTSDPTIHNVNVSAPRNQSRNNAMVQGQAPLEYEFQRPDTVHLRCDIHPWMSAWVHVSAHPWFAVSDGGGEFSIPDLPPGQYVIEVQHEEFGILQGSVTIEPNQSTGVTFEFDVD